MYINTAIYIRVSTEEQVSEGFSIHAQKDKLTKYAEVNDYKIIDYYIDEGISGKNLQDRKEVSRLINDIKLSKIDNVLVYKLDRLTRSVKDLIYLIELFDKYNCTFNSQTEKIDTSNAVGRMFVKIIGLFAEFERENLAERITLGYEQKTKEGNYTNCNGVFGYNYLIGQGKLIINKKEAYYVKRIYEWYLNGDSMLKIAQKLKKMNVPTKRGGQWCQSTISSILKNPLYIGNIRYGVNKKNNFEVVGKNITKIINKDMFYNVQDLLNKRKKSNYKKNSSDNTYYFKVLKCAHCNNKYHARIQIQNGKQYITYKCNGYYNNTCNVNGFSHYKLENAFLKYLDNVRNFKYDKNIIKNINEMNNLNKEEKIIEKNIDLIGKVIVDLKTNFMKLNNHEKKIFLERFIKEIKVKKENNQVIIENILFEYN